jgi:DNA repair protein RecO (recombination protein O)
MEWTDEGIVLAARMHGESAAIVTLLTRAHGRHLGLVRGGAGRRARGHYEPGNRVLATWRARLAEHLGNYRCELLQSQAAGLLDDSLRLSALASAAALVDAALPEREPHTPTYEGMLGLIAALCADAADIDWAQRYVRFELDLLADLGFGLDLGRCAATGAVDDLAFVSPRTGRAVSRTAGEPYKKRLLPLPRFLVGADSGARPGDWEDVRAALTLTGFFFDRHVFARDRRPHQAGFPAARERFLARLHRTEA